MATPAYNYKWAKSEEELTDFMIRESFLLFLAAITSHEWPYSPDKRQYEVYKSITWSYRFCLELAAGWLANTNSYGISKFTLSSVATSTLQERHKTPDASFLRKQRQQKSWGVRLPKLAAVPWMKATELVRNKEASSGDKAK
ncbi:MAG: hypothetical protein LBJ38_00140 [Oscillospiraceae bacterium]|nr:hypothetical protein [Oscillospiraceae bacterium]